MNSASTRFNRAVWVVNSLAILGAFLIVAGLVWAMRHYTKPPPIDAGRAAERAKALTEMRAADTAALHNAGWIDPTKGVVRLPIAQAMKLIVAEWQKDPAAVHSDLTARVEKATAPPPKAPEKPNPFE